MWKKLIPIVAGAAILFVAACDSVEDEGGVVALTGLVLDTANEPVAGAFVAVQPFGRIVETDALGRFATEVEVDSSMQLTINVSKDGFSNASTSVFGIPDRTITVPTIRLQQTSEQAPESGRVSNILLLEQSAQSIGVKESGSQEVAKLTFQLADSVGRPITVEHAAEVRFTLGAQPGGGEFIHPTVATTDNNGTVTVNLSSGTKAGAVQIVAETTVEDHVVRSKPVSLAIHGGLPDQLHFSLGPETFNYPGLLAYGLKNPVGVVVGDKYANPVRPGTVVYFTTSFGVIEGSATTDGQGEGSVNFISANPLPPRGITTVTATTADENNDTVIARIPMVLTGAPWIFFSDPPPIFAQLNHTYNVTVSDGNINPLVEGTQFTVEAQGTKVKAVGNTSVSLPKTGFFDFNGDGDIFDYEDIVRGQGITEFRFRAVVDLEAEGEGEPSLEAIVIKVEGANGTLEIALTPTDILAVSQRAVVEVLHDGRQVARLDR